MTKDVSSTEMFNEAPENVHEVYQQSINKASAVQARYGTKARELITTTESLEKKSSPYLHDQRQPPHPFLETIYLKEHLPKKEKVSFLKSEEYLPLKTIWQIT